MKTQKRQGVQTPRGETSKVNLTLSVEAYRRLFVTSVMSGRTASSIVEDLIVEGLRQFSMPANLTARASSRQSTQSVDSSVQTEPVVADAA